MEFFVNHQLVFVMYIEYIAYLFLFWMCSCIFLLIIIIISMLLSYFFHHDKPKSQDLP